MLTIPRGVLRTSSVLTIARLVGAGLIFATHIAIARVFGAETLGLLAIALAVAGIASVLLPLGRPSIAVALVSKYLASDETGRAAAFARQGYREIALTTAILGLIAGAAMLLPETLVPARFQNALVFAAVAGPGLALILFNGGLLLAYRKPAAAMLPEALLRPVAVVAILGLSVLLAGMDESWIVFIAFGAAVWLGVFYQFAVLYRLRAFCAPEAEEGDPKFWRKKARPWIWVGALSDYLIDVLLVVAALMLGATELAILHICFRIRGLAGYGMRTLYNIVLPDVFRAHAVENREAFHRQIASANVLALLYAATVVAVALLAGDHVLRLAGPAFEAGYATLAVLCATMISRALFGPATAIMASTGQEKTAVGTLLFGFVFALAAAVAFVPEFGILGLAIAYFASTTLVAFAQWQRVKRFSGLDTSIAALFWPVSNRLQTGN